jgi:hypothetical protein
MTSDTKKNKGVNKKEKHKNEEKIDPNDLVVKLTGKQKNYPEKGRRKVICCWSLLFIFDANNW